MNIPGLPALPPLVGIILSVPLIFADAIRFLTSFGGAQWGIFLDGELAIEADSVVSFGYKQDWSISTFPVEDGGFQSYNKVDTPYSARIRFSSGGSQANRQALLDNITAVSATLDLYDLVTPEAVYTSANIQGFNYHRTNSNGVGMMIVDIQIVEVRVTATAEFSNTKSPSATGSVSDGTVQPKALSDANANAVRDGL